MKVSTGVVRDFGELVEEAESIIRDGIISKQIPDEPATTNRFLQELESTINRRGQIRGVQFSSRTLTSLGPNAEESVVGADFIAIIDVQLPGYAVSKGFLCQAKNNGRGVNVDYTTRRNIKVGFNQAATLKKLQSQTEKMLKTSPDSFVIIYGNDGFVLVPALSINSINYSNDGNHIYGKNTRLFFQEFLMCFIGDRRLNAFDDITLAARAEETKSRYGIIIQLRKQG